MVDIKNFIKDARIKGLTDTQIKSALSSNGWSEAVIDVALLGLDIPQARVITPESESAPTTQQPKQPSLSHLMAALQHVLLWFFTCSSIVTIIGVVRSLSGYEVSTEVLASMIAVTLVTFTPYAILFLLFLVKARRTPGLIPGKVWSIITICFHSIGAMIAGITIVITLITSGEWNVTLSALLILALTIIMIITYGFASFSPLRLRKLRKVTLIAHLPILLIVFGTLFIMSVLQLGPAKHDEQMRKDLTGTVEKIHSYAQTNKILPTSESNIVIGNSITYRQKNKVSYELCGDFQTVSKNQSYNQYRGGSQPYEDDYVSEYDFYTETSGHHCFEFSSSTLAHDNGSYYGKNLDSLNYQ